LVPDAPETKDFHIVGSPSHDDYCAYVALCGGVEDYEPRFDVAIQFMKEHPQSVVSVYVANKLLTNGYNLTSEQLQQLEKTITGCPSDTARFARFQERIAIAHQTVTGNSIVNLDLVTPEGTSCQLADVVKEHAGKLLLVDFWASWCGICRAATPDLKVLYETYSRDQFEIISVSCDEKDDAWRSAMEKDQMPWTQYCLTAQGYQDFFSKYQVVGVPYYLLLDSNGKVITNPSGVEGVKKLVKEKLQ
jgi:thiol-disulfide isomerase/thioredoxin